MSGNSENSDNEVLVSDAIFKWALLAIEYAIVSSLILLAGVVLVRTIATFINYGTLTFPVAVVGGVDGILVVIIILDIAHTVFGQLRTSVFLVRPFLVIGILAGIRDILSASARLSLGVHVSETSFHDTLLSLSVGVGVVLFLLIGLFILEHSERTPAESAV